MRLDNIDVAELVDAVKRGIEEERREIEAIVGNPAEPTFSNTLQELDYAGIELARAENLLWILLGVQTTPQLEAAAEELMPLLSAHNHWIAYNKALYERIVAVGKSDEARSLDGASRKLLVDTLRAFRLRGIGLSRRKQARLEEISLELQNLALKFKQNALADREAYRLNVTDEAEIDGLPELQRGIAKEEAEGNGESGWTFTLDGPSMGGVLTYCTDRKLRYRLWNAASRIGWGRRKTSNIEIIRRIVNLRLEEARLLGCKCFAEVVLKSRMARNVATVERFLNNLCGSYKEAAEAELNDVRQYASAHGSKLRAWDKAFYSRQLRSERFGFDPQEFRPYLELSRVIEGVFGLASRLYGLRFEPLADAAVYHPDVKVFAVADSDGRRLATLYTDFHPRKGKRSGAWMTTFSDQYVDREGNDVRPEVLLAMNLTKPTGETPSLLSIGEVRTFLHEFGHGLHAILSRCRYRSQSGTNVAWDFVELPSQLMENFASEPAFLHTFAVHYKTGEPLPNELIEKLRASEQFGAATACMRQLQYGMLDMAYHTLREPLEGDVPMFEKEAWAAARVGKRERRRSCMTASFEHIMTGGYAAGYYSYKWAEVLDADAFELFRENGVISPQVAGHFRKEVLERGSSEREDVLYRNFRGHKPSIAALLKRDGVSKDG